MILRQPLHQLGQWFATCGSRTLWGSQNLPGVFAEKCEKWRIFLCLQFDKAVSNLAYFSMAHVSEKNTLGHCSLTGKTNV
jgi:hypothetical protein